MTLSGSSRISMAVTSLPADFCAAAFLPSRENAHATTVISAIIGSRRKRIKVGFILFFPLSLSRWDLGHGRVYGKKRTSSAISFAALHPASGGEYRGEYPRTKPRGAMAKRQPEITQF